MAASGAVAQFRRKIFEPMVHIDADADDGEMRPFSLARFHQDAGNLVSDVNIVRGFDGRHNQSVRMMVATARLPSG